VTIDSSRIVTPSNIHIKRATYLQSRKWLRVNPALGWVAGTGKQCRTSLEASRESDNLPPEKPPADLFGQSGRNTAADTQTALLELRHRACSPPNAAHHPV
jgi:hypothetical protein